VIFDGIEGVFSSLQSLSVELYACLVAFSD